MTGREPSGFEQPRRHGSPPLGPRHAPPGPRRPGPAQGAAPRGAPRGAGYAGAPSRRKPMPNVSTTASTTRPPPGPSDDPTQPIQRVTRSEQQAARRGGNGRGGDDGRGERRGRPRPRRRGLKIAIVLGLIALPFVLAIGWFGYEVQKSGDSGQAVTFEVESGMGTGDVADALADAGVIDSALAFKLWSTVTGAGPFEIGTYELHEGQGIRGAISALDKGPNAEPNQDSELLLPPGLTLQQIAERVGKLPGKSAEKFLAAVQSAEQTGSIRSKYQPPEVRSLEGFLFPDTYRIGATETEDSIVRRLVQQFDLVADRVGLANVQGLTPYQAIVAASLIQTEAKLAEDAPLISAVIRNRLADGQPLQIDSTLCFARQQATGAGCPPPPTNADKEIDSPYNTYRVAGLPPTPISSVTEASLAAAITPADVPFKYYVIADENGKHVFATTLEEHERNVAAARQKGLL